MAQWQDLFVHKTTTLSQYRPPVVLTNGTPRVNKCLAAEMLKLGLIPDPSHKILKSGWRRSVAREIQG